jgi:hypothetical protein
MKEKALVIADKTPAVTKGTAGLRTFAGAQPATVSALAMASGGIGRGRLVEPNT